jgi:hypothetical protein
LWQGSYSHKNLLFSKKNFRNNFGHFDKKNA